MPAACLALQTLASDQHYWDFHVCIGVLKTREHQELSWDPKANGTGQLLPCPGCGSCCGQTSTVVQAGWVMPYVPGRSLPLEEIECAHCSVLC